MKKEESYENPSTLSYYSHNFRFYFAGFSIAVGIFIILFVLWFFSFNKTPQLLSNPKVLNYVGDSAFISDFSGEKEELVVKKNPISTILTAYPRLYHIWEKQLPSLDKNYYLIKKQNTTSPTISSLIRDLRLPEIKTNALKWWAINAVSFYTPNNNYIVDLDLSSASISLINSDTALISWKQFTEKEIKKFVKSELTTLWLSLKYYDDPLVFQETPGYLDLFYPRLIDDIPVYLSENEQDGIRARFDLKNWKLLSVVNYSSQSYLVSKTPLGKTEDDLLKELQQRWDIDITKKWVENAVQMEEWELIYLDKWAYLIPSFLFKSKNTEEVVILPLY